MRSFAILACLTCACGEGRQELRIDVRSDLVPGIEVNEFAVRVVDDPALEATMDAAGRDWITGDLLAAFEVPSGLHDVEVSAMLDGDVVVTRRVVVRVRERTAVTVVLTRSCRDVACPDAGGSPSAISCLGGACVEPSCIDGRGPDCPDPATCEDTCASSIACVSATCVEGVCLMQPDDTACGAGTCNPDQGCTCAPGFESLPGATPLYAIESTTGLAFDDAVAACAALGEGHSLALPRNDEERLAIDARIDGLDHSRWWIGGELVEGEWVDLEGAPLSYLPFGTGEPNGGDPAGCLALMSNPDEGPGRDGFFDDLLCTLERFYLCQCEL